ncbi:hypothetical protein GCM10027075_39620 [Streptomyces heilongjiangensis]
MDRERGRAGGKRGSAGAVSAVAKGHSEARGGLPVRGTREGMRRPRGGARDEFPDSSRPPPPSDGPRGKLPPAEGTSCSCYRRALTSPHSLTPQPFPRADASPVTA